MLGGRGRDDRADSESAWRSLQNQKGVAGLRRSRTKCNSIRWATRARAPARAPTSRVWCRNARRRPERRAAKEKAIGRSATVVRRADVPRPIDFCFFCCLTLEVSGRCHSACQISATHRSGPLDRNVRRQGRDDRANSESAPPNTAKPDWPCRPAPIPNERQRDPWGYACPRARARGNKPALEQECQAQARTTCGEREGDR